MRRRSLEDAAHEVARISLLLADALEGGDLASAERLADERADLLVRWTGAEWTEEARSEELPRLGSLIAHAERRGRVALEREVATLRRQVAVSIEANRAMIRYHSSEPVDAGFVDRRD